MDLLADNVFFLRAYIPKKYWFVNVNLQDPVSGIGSWGFKSPARSELMLLNPEIDKLSDLHIKYFDIKEKWTNSSGMKTTNLMETLNKVWSFVQ